MKNNAVCNISQYSHSGTFYWELHNAKGQCSNHCNIDLVLYYKTCNKTPCGMIRFLYYGGMLCFSDKINELLVYRDLLAVKVTVRFKLPSCVGLGSSGWCRSMDVSVIDWCVCRCLLRMHCCRLASDFGDHSATDVTG